MEFEKTCRKFPGVFRDHVHTYNFPSHNEGDISFLKWILLFHGEPSGSSASYYDLAHGKKKKFQSCGIAANDNFSH